MSGLEYAHRQGIIHRDVKPGNLLLIGGPAGNHKRGAGGHDPPTGEMTVKLADFGIARAAEQTRLTQVGSVVGTAAYLAPEQARGEEATPAADVFALGVVVYQLLTGRLPWEGSTLAELSIRRENERPLSPSSYDPGIPEELSTAVLRALEGIAANRYTTARDFSAAMRSGLAGIEPRSLPRMRRPGSLRLRPRPRVRWPIRPHRWPSSAPSGAPLPHLLRRPALSSRPRPSPSARRSAGSCGCSACWS